MFLRGMIFEVGVRVMPTVIHKCRICGNTNLVPVLDLGEQFLTGIFPRTQNQHITKGPLRLVKCQAECSEDVCGLLQLSHSYDLGEMYGDSYGYRSGLNPSMIRHLHDKVARIIEIARLELGDLIVDIGSNDGTTLRAYPAGRYQLAGIDPTGAKFRQYYPPHVELLPDFFSLARFIEKFGERKAKVVTSFSMFYDLEDPVGFMREVREVLHTDGLWVFEQSYMPAMLQRNSYDTVCHEHLEYYGLKQIKWMLDRAGLRIVNVEFNDINGGSFSIAAARVESAYPSAPDLEILLCKEESLGLDGLAPYREFADRVARSRDELLGFLGWAKREGKLVAALGASTKGNVLLQYCGVTENELPYVGEVNPEKCGCLTPGTLLPILAEDELLKMEPDYLLVLPWHFREFFLSREKFRGRQLVFPLPRLVIHVA